MISLVMPALSLIRWLLGAPTLNTNRLGAHEYRWASQPHLTLQSASRRAGLGVKWLAFALSIVATSAVCAPEDRWITVTQNDNMIVLVDKETLSGLNGPIVTAWARWELQSNAVVISSDNSVQSQLRLIDANCTKRTLRTRRIMSFDGPHGDGNVPDDAALDSELTVPPGTPEEALFRFLCKRSK